MMKTLIISCAFLALAYAATSPLEVIPIVSQGNEVNADGSYRSFYETGNGIKAEEHGELKNRGAKDTEASEVVGSISYTAPDGTPIEIKYIANEFGFQPEGRHLPTPPTDTNTPPPIPAAILRSLEYNAAHPWVDESEKTVKVGRQ